MAALPRRVALLVLLAPLILAGCLPRPAESPQGPPPSARQLLAQLDVAAARVQGFSGLAAGRLEQGTERYSFNQVLVVRRPDRLRLEVLGLFGQPALVLASDGATLMAFEAGSGQYYRGAATVDNLARLTRVPLEPESLLALLCAAAPRWPYATAESAWSGGLAELRLNDGRREQRFRFDADGRLVAADYRLDGEPQLQVAYAGFAADGFPRSMQLALPGRDLRVSLQLSEVSLNPATAAARFTLVPPAGAVVLSLP